MYIQTWSLATTVVPTKILNLVVESPARKVQGKASVCSNPNPCDNPHISAWLLRYHTVGAEAFLAEDKLE